MTDDILIFNLNVENTSITVTNTTLYLLLVETLLLFLLVTFFAQHFMIKKLTKRLDRIDSIGNGADTYK